MEYQTPEIATLGPAIELIQGGKGQGQESSEPQNEQLGADCELDD